MKKSLSIGLLFASAAMLGQSITNPGFESYNTLPVCPTGSTSNTSITHCQTWSGLSSNYGTSCTYTNSSAGSSGVQYFNGASGGTSTCQPVTAHGGTGYAFLRGWGFYPNTIGHSEYLYQTVNSLTGGTSYLVQGYMHTQGTWLGLSAWLVSTSVGSTATAILNDLRSQAIPSTHTSTTSTWVAVTMMVTPPSTGNYYLVLGDNSACKDGAATNVGTMAVDDFTISVAPTCTANAGTAKTNTTSCCPPGPCTGVTIGTTSLTGQYYSWTPTATVNNPYIAQPTATPCSTVAPTVYTVTVTGDACATATSTVQVTTVQYNGPSCCRIGHYSGKEVTAFLVYPNPAKDKFTVTLYGIPEYVRIMDVTGKLIYEGKNVPESELQVDVSKFPKGVYYVTAKIGDRIEKQTVVVE